jgi:hypothetical protein
MMQMQPITSTPRKTVPVTAPIYVDMPAMTNPVQHGAVPAGDHEVAFRITIPADALSSMAAKRGSTDT